MSSEEPATEHVPVDDLADFLSGTLTEEERARVNVHLNHCARCREELAIAGETLRELEAERRRPPWLWPAAAVAAVASALLLLPTGPFGDPAPPTPVERSGSEALLRMFDIVAPADGAEIGTAGLTFSWVEPEAGATYELTLTDDTGDILWSASTQATTLTLPDTVLLGLGLHYWVVDALLEGADEATTGVHEFRILP